MMPTKLLSLAQSPADRDEVNGLADKMALEIIQESPKDELYLLFDQRGLALVKNELTLHGDFTKMIKRLNPANLRGELLVRAAKTKAPQGVKAALDATAGLGEDSLLLAASGFEVDLYEYNPIIAALLRDALRRAAQETELKEIVARMHLIEADSKKAMLSLEKRPDVILLDPMFPARRKSALVKKKFQLIQNLEQPCTDESELIQSAIAAHPKKIVIKRTLKGPILGDIKPSYAISGKGIRYDCITLV